MKSALQIFIVIIMLTGVENIFAQTDSTTIYRITLTDDSELIGKIKSENDSLLVFVTNAGLELSLDWEMIKGKEMIQGEWEGNTFLHSDPNRTRLLFSPTGRTLPAGEGYFSAYEIFFPFLAIGITDFITLSGGISLFPGAEEQVIYVAPKLRVLHLENFDLSSGVLYCHTSESDFGIFYGVTTIGSSKASFTLGLGWGYVDGETAESPAIMFGGELQLSNSVKLVTENWKLPEEEDLVISFGFRFFGEHLAADFGLVTTTGEKEGFPFLPWIGFAYNF
jgi:hypothetical protein